MIDLNGLVAKSVEISKKRAGNGGTESFSVQNLLKHCATEEQDKPNVFQQFLEKELPEDIQRRVERAAEYGESNAEYFFRAGFFLAHELEEAKKNNQDGGKINGLCLFASLDRKTGRAESTCRS